MARPTASSPRAALSSVAGALRCANRGLVFQVPGASRISVTVLVFCPVPDWVGSWSLPQTRKSRFRFCGTPKFAASRICSDIWYPSDRNSAFISSYRAHGRMWITFSMIIQPGLKARAKRIACKAVALLSSDRGPAPFAHVWFVHSGEASIRSMLPISARNFAGLISSSLSVFTIAPGKFAEKVRVAISDISTPQTISAPADLAPKLLPPPPQNKSKTRIAEILSSRFGALLPGSRTSDQAQFMKNKICTTS